MSQSLFYTPVSYQCNGLNLAIQIFSSTPSREATVTGVEIHETLPDFFLILNALVADCV